MGQYEYPPSLSLSLSLFLWSGLSSERQERKRASSGKNPTAMTIMGARARASLHHVDTSCACRRARYRCHRSRRIIGLDAMKLPVVSPQRAASWRYSARLARIAPSVSAVGFGLVRGQVESAMYHGTYARDDDAALQLARVLASLPPSLSCFPFLPLRERERDKGGEESASWPIASASHRIPARESKEKSYRGEIRSDLRSSPI